MSNLFVIYNDVVEGVRWNLNELGAEMASAAIDETNSLRGRWEIRDQIQKINSIFAVSISLYYFQSFLAAIFISAGVILGGSKYSLGTVTLLTFCCHVLALYLMASNASDVDFSAGKLQCDVLRRLSLNADSAVYDTLLVNTFHFREDWDSLRVGCFAHSLRSLGGFVAAVTTNAAVVLQFDYRVVRTISDAADRIPSGR